MLERIGDLEPEERRVASLDGEFVLSEEERKEWEMKRFEESCFARMYKILERMEGIEAPDDTIETQYSDHMSKKARCLMAQCTLIKTRRACHLPVGQLVTQLSTSPDVPGLAITYVSVFKELVSCCDEKTMDKIYDTVPVSKINGRRDLYQIIDKTTRLSEKSAYDETHTILADDLEQRFNAALLTSSVSNLFMEYFDRYMEIIRHEPERVSRVLKSILCKLIQNTESDSILLGSVICPIGILCAKFGLMDEAKNAWDWMQRMKKVEDAFALNARMAFALSRASVSSNLEQAEIYFKKGLSQFLHLSSLKSRTTLDMIELATQLKNPREWLLETERLMCNRTHTPSVDAKLIEAYTRIGAKQDATRRCVLIEQDLGLSYTLSELEDKLPETIARHIAYADVQKTEGTDPRHFLLQFSQHIQEMLDAKKASSNVTFDGKDLDGLMNLAKTLTDHQINPTPLLDTITDYFTEYTRNKSRLHGKVHQYLFLILTQEAAWATKQIMISRKKSAT